MCAPKFINGYNPEKHYDANPIRAENKKLAALVKKEKKGALRELKKDAAFLAAEKSKQIKASDAEYKKKIDRIYGMLGSEQAEMNAQKRFKNRK